MDADKLRCFYCDVPLTARVTEWDHAPVPRRHGGGKCVPCCKPCHTMKDRVPLDRWPDDWIAIVEEDFPKLRRETRIFIGKSLALFADAADTLRKYAYLDEEEAEK